jgi:hypothetical protein
LGESSEWAILGLESGAGVDVEIFAFGENSGQMQIRQANVLRAVGFEISNDFLVFVELQDDFIFEIFLGFALKDLLERVEAEVAGAVLDFIIILLDVFDSVHSVLQRSVFV